MTANEVAATVAECQSPGMLFYVKQEDGYFYLQIHFNAPEDEQSWTGTRPLVVHKGRKWLLSEHMTKNEIVQTCFLAVMTVVEHEVREHFRYKGRKIYNPHWSPDVLHEMSKVGNLDLRPKAVRSE